MTGKGKIEVKILVANRYFLYLPLYLAQFDRPESGKRAFFGKIPSNYSVEVTVPERESDQTDKAVFDDLMDARLGSSSSIMFAACDPTVLLARQAKNALMLGSLVANSAFWAVNHDARNVRLVSDLSSFDRILCYKEGTTSNLIARRIAKRNTGKLIVVRSSDEIQQLDALGEGTLAISPELLKITNLVNGKLRPGEKRAQIVLDLGTSKEFSNVLTTALFTRREVVDEHPELVSGLLAALQSALIAIQAGQPIVKESALANFLDAHRLDDALALAGSSNVFPETIQVRRDRWQRACEFYYMSLAIAEGREKSSLNKTEQLTAEELYSQAVLDPGLRSLVAKAITRGFLDATPTVDTWRWSGQASLAACGLLAIGFGIGQAFAAVASSAKVAVGLSWTLMLCVGWWSGDLVGYQKPSRPYAGHWVSVVISWWALHELVVPRSWDAHFLAGVAIDGALAGGMLTVAVFTMGAAVWARKEAQKLTSPVT